MRAFTPIKYGGRGSLRSMTAREAQSPYQLSPGPDRRAMMHGMGIPVCPLDYDDAEWAAMQAGHTRSSTAAEPAADVSEHIARQA